MTVKFAVQLATLAVLAGVCFLPAAELACGSAESMDRLMTVWTAGFTALHPDTPARVTRRARFSAALTGALARGDVRVAAFARELFPAEQARFADLAGGAARLVPVATGSRATKGGTHAIAIFVNGRNPIGRLSLPQLWEIFARDGRITTWGQLGLGGDWAARKISLQGMRVRRATGNPPGIVNFLEKRLLAGRAWRDDLHGYTDAPAGGQSLAQIVRAVAADEAALGYSGFGYAVPGVKTLALGETDAGPFFAGTAAEVARREYPLTRTIYLAVGPAPDATTRAFLHYVLGREGQRAIAADTQGFFPLTAAAAAVARARLAGVDPALPPYEPHPVEVPRTAPYLTHDGAIAIVGYNDMRGLIAAWDERFAAVHPGCEFAPTLKGTRTAPPALARGRSAFAPMGAEFSPSQMAEYRAATGREPIPFRVAHDSLGGRALSGPLAIVVHRDNPLAALTLDQVGKIFSGEVTRWGDLGVTGEWAARAVHPCGLRAELALGIFLRERAGIGAAFGPAFRGFGQSAEVVGQVGADSLAIGFTAVNRVVPGVKVLAIARDARTAPVALSEENVRAGRYPLDRFLLIYARQPLEPLVREYLRLVLSQEGQEIVAADALGYLPLNAGEAAVERAKLASAR